MNDDDAKRCWGVFLEHRGQLARYVRNMLPTGDDATDVVQEVALRLLSQPCAPAPMDALPAWCKAVARRVVLHELRAARYERSKLAALRVCSPVDSSAREATPATKIAVRRWLSEVTEEEREMLVRRYLLEENSWEIAEAMTMTPAAVRMRLMRLRRNLLPDESAVEDRRPSEPGS